MCTGLDVGRCDYIDYIVMALTARAYFEINMNMLCLGTYNQSPHFDWQVKLTIFGLDDNHQRPRKPEHVDQKVPVHHLKCCGECSEIVSACVKKPALDGTSAA